jgi:hypothetical protein
MPIGGTQSEEQKVTWEVENLRERVTGLLDEIEILEKDRDDWKAKAIEVALGYFRLATQPKEQP